MLPIFHKSLCQHEIYVYKHVSGLHIAIDNFRSPTINLNVVVRTGADDYK